MLLHLVRNSFEKREESSYSQLYPLIVHRLRSVAVPPGQSWESSCAGDYHHATATHQGSGQARWIRCVGFHDFNLRCIASSIFEYRLMCK
jgi:hypothetical protein